jgi:hypothetical protein
LDENQWFVDYTERKRGSERPSDVVESELAMSVAMT